MKFIQLEDLFSLENCIASVSRLEFLDGIQSQQLLSVKIGLDICMHTGALEGWGEIPPKPQLSSVEPNSPTRCEESEQIEDTSLAEIEENSMEEVEEISESE